jgi:hypothetical protein
VPDSPTEACHAQESLVRTVAYAFTIGLSRAGNLDRSVHVRGTNVILDIASQMV